MNRLETPIKPVNMLVRINRLTHLYITLHYVPAAAMVSNEQRLIKRDNVKLGWTNIDCAFYYAVFILETCRVSASNGPINAAYRRLGTGTVGGTAGAKNVLYVLITRTPSTVNLLAVNIMYYFSTSVYMQPLGSMPYVQRTRHIV